MSQPKTTSWIYKFLLLGTIWGSSFLFISLGLETLSPTGIAFWRTFIGAITLLAVMLIGRIKFVRGWNAWIRIWIAGLFMSAIPAVLFGFAETRVSSALASIMNASTPVFTVLAILIAFRAEKPKPQVLAGLGVGLVGVLVVLGVWNGFGENDPLAVGAGIVRREPEFGFVVRGDVKPIVAGLRRSDPAAPALTVIFRKVGWCLPGRDQAAGIGKSGVVRRGGQVADITAAHRGEDIPPESAPAESADSVDDERGRRTGNGSGRIGYNTVIVAG